MQNGKSLKIALMFSAVGEYSTQVIGFVSLMILARLLTPDEIGVYAVAGTASILATELSSFGVVQYLIREKDIHEEKIRSVLGMSIIVSWGLGVLLILTAPYIAVFYEEQAIEGILWILSISFFLGPFISVPFALWKRELQFNHISIFKITSQLVITISSISLVLLGFSYYGLAIGATIGMISRILITILLKPEGAVWIPSFKLVKSMAKFGFFASLTNVFERFNESIPDLVIGKLATMADVGYFSRGFGAVLFLKKILYSAVAPVILPHYAEVKRSGRSVVEAYLRSVKLLLAFLLPAFAVASAASYPMIIGLFGGQWGSAVPIASILALWAMFVSVHSFAGSAFIVAGDEKLMFMAKLVVSVVRLALVVSAASHGIEMVAWAMVVSGIIELLINTAALKKSIGLTVSKLVIALLPILLITLVCWVTTIFIDQIIVFRETNAFHALALITVCLFTVWMLMLRLTKHEAWYMIWDILGKVKTRYLSA